MNSHGGHRFPGIRGDNLQSALKWAQKRLSSYMEYGFSTFPCPPYQALSRMHMADTLTPKIRLVWAIATDIVLICMCVWQAVYSHSQNAETIYCGPGPL